MSNKSRSFLFFFVLAWALTATGYILYENPAIDPTIDPQLCQFEHIAGKFQVAAHDIHTTKSMVKAIGPDGRVHMFRTAALYACQGASQ